MWRRRWTSYVGIAILVAIGLESISGWLLWVAGHRRAWLAAALLEAIPDAWPSAAPIGWLLDVPRVTDLHVQAGYVLLGLVGAKIGLVWWLLRNWFPRRFGPARLVLEKVAAWALPLVYGSILLTGVALDQRLGLVWGRSLVRDVHLWSSELAAPITAWHLLRFWRIVWRISRRDLTVRPRAGPE
ncbi:MAG TPA: hypothetical protein VEQ11_21880 [Chloroflexota bacterium]|nr:hypothetical protein [Chloroflexota bacterium]